MAFPDQLLEQAQHLANRERTKPRQASLRRAVSTAYYALFHLLTTEAAKNWKQLDQRHALARLFEHGRMKSASKKWLNDNPHVKPALILESHLRVVAETFVQAQQHRHTADYDNSAQWTRTDVTRQIRAVAAAFQSWKVIRQDPRAQAYLVSLLGKDR